VATGKTTHENWDELVRRIFEGYASADYAAALAAAETAAERFPEADVHTAYWRACLQAKLGDLSGAVGVLSDALDRGCWWSGAMLRDDEDLAPLADRAEYEQVVLESERRERAANAHTRPETSVLDASAPTNVLVVGLHGRTEDGSAALARWSPAASRAVVAAVQSSQTVGSGSFSWDDRELGALEIADACRAITAERGLDRIVLGGFSQGGTLAVAEAMLGTRIPALGFVAVAPTIGRMGMPDIRSLRELLPAAAVAGVRGALIVGDRDPRVEDSLIFARDAERAGVAVHQDLVEDLGHEFPSDFDDRLAVALDFVLAG
jgi:predicted esterase